MKTLYTSLTLFFALWLSVHGQSNGSYDLINSVTDLPVAVLSDGDRIDLSVQGRQLNIQAVPDGSLGPVGSVRFSSPGWGIVESTAPYAYRRDTAGDYHNWEPAPGPLTITVRYYSASGGGGTLLGTDVLSLEVVEAGDTSPPPAPTGLRAGRVGATSVELLWAPPSDASGISGHTVYLDGTAVATVGNVGSHTVAGLSPSVPYTFRVSARDGANNDGALSAPLTVSTSAGADRSPPGRPVLSVGGTTQNSVTLSWTAVPDNVGVASHEVFDATGTLLATVGNVTSHTVTGLSPGTTSGYAVRALDAAGNAGALSEQVSATTAMAGPGHYARFYLIDAASDSRIMELFGGEVLDLAVVGRSLNIEAVRPMGAAFRGPVRFSSTDGHSMVEANAPMAYRQDTAGDFHAWEPAPGELGITVRYYEGGALAPQQIARDDIALTFTDGADTVPPTTVTGLGATEVTEVSLRLDWSPSTDTGSGLASYRVYVDNALSGTVTVPGHTVTGLSAGTAHELTVVAVDAAGNTSPPSLPLTVATPDLTAPTAPTAPVLGMVTAEGAQVSWTAAADNVGVTAHRVHVDGGAGPLIGAATSHLLTGLSAGRAHTVRISALDAAGNEGALSPPLSVEVPGGAGLFARYDLVDATTDRVLGQLFDGRHVALSDFVAGQFNIDAVPPAGGAGVGSVRFSADPGHVHVENIAPYAYGGNIGPVPTDFSDVALPPAGTVRFTVSYHSGAGATGTVLGTDTFEVVFTSGPDNEPPAAVRPRATEITDSSLRLFWAPPADNVGVVGYELLRDGLPVAGSPFPASRTSYADTGLSPGREYVYVLRALDAAGNRGGDLPLAVTTLSGSGTPPTVPTGLTGRPGPGTGYTLMWSPSTDTDLAGYRIHVEGLAPIAIGIDDTYSVTGLAELAPYTFRISALDAAGNESAPSAPHTGISGDATPPVAGTLSVTGLGPSRVEIAISGTSDNSGAIGGRTVLVDGARERELAAGDTGFALTGLVRGRAYRVEVEVRDPAGNASRTAALEAVPRDVSDNVPPAAPVLSLLERGFSEITVSWPAVADASGISSYRIELDGAPVATLPGDQGRYTLTGLEGERAYLVRALAVDGAGNTGPGSAPLAVSTTVAPGYGGLELSDGNYVYTRTYQKGRTDHTGTLGARDLIEDVAYMDGLGRELQRIGVKQSPNGHDLVTICEYDAAGRKAVEHLPYEGDAGVHGPLRGATASRTAIDAYYGSRYGDDLGAVPNAYSQTSYEASPLNRPLQIAAPGESWKMGGGHEIGMAYGTNGPGEVPHLDVAYAAQGGYGSPSLVRKRFLRPRGAP